MTDEDGHDAVPTLDVDALQRWLDTLELPDAGTPVGVDYISGGSQNEIFAITRGDQRWALRKPPQNAVAARDNGILREWQILDALTGTDVPHASAVAHCADPSVLGRPFYVMGYVDGWSPMAHGDLGGWAAPFDTDADARGELARALVDGAARLGRVDWRAAGLAEFGRPEGFHDRQVDRWLRFWENCGGRTGVPGMEVATAWLREHRPIDFVPGIMHGDYQFANVMFEHGTPGRLAAIVDWEMTTIGDPKLDLAWCLRDWPGGGATSDSTDYMDLSAVPSRDELVTAYADVSGRQVDDFDYYLVLARWKLGVVLEQGFQNAGDNELLLSFGRTVDSLMAAAAELAESTDYEGRHLIS
ncbi:phosphotransferase family protein [Jatrophihabitans fulvus]